MKRSDIAVIILLASIALVAGYFIGQAILSSDGKKQEEVEVVDPIVAEVVEPDKQTFNETAINPAVQVMIGESANAKPFNAN